MLCEMLHREVMWQCDERVCGEYMSLFVRSRSSSSPSFRGARSRLVLCRLGAQCMCKHACGKFEPMGVVLLCLPVLPLAIMNTHNPGLVSSGTQAASNEGYPSPLYQDYTPVWLCLGHRLCRPN